MLTLENLYDYLLNAKKRNAMMVLTFDDTDKYALCDVDLCFSVGHDGARETEPLVVAFVDCLDESKKRLQAYRDGELNTAGVYWTSTEPIAPVNMEYTIEQLVTVWDDVKNYVAYDRDAK